MWVRSLYYCEHDNIIIDEDGRPVYDIFKVLSPNKLLWCKQKRGTYYFKSEYERDVTYEIVFPLEGEDAEYYYSYVERTY